MLSARLGGRLAGREIPRLTRLVPANERMVGDLVLAEALREACKAAKPIERMQGDALKAFSKRVLDLLGVASADDERNAGGSGQSLLCHKRLKAR